MADQRRLVVVGASLAGLRAVEAARKSGFAGPITLVGAEEHLPYDRPPLSKAFLEDPASEPAVFRTREHLTDELGVHLLLGQPATALDAASGTVHVGDRDVAYDALVLATGASARTLPFAGVRRLRTVDDALEIRGALAQGARIVVVGAGFIGSEIASSAAKRSLTATVLEGAAVPLVRAVGPEMGDALAHLHRINGTDLRTGVNVTGVCRTSVGLAVETDSGRFDADLVVGGIGAAPTVDWLEGSGVTIDDGVVCDAQMWTGLPGVYAAGDIARWHNPHFDITMRLENWTSAAEQGAVAALNALGAQNMFATVPYFWSDWYGTRIQFVGIPHADEVRVVEGSIGSGRFVAVYRTAARVTGTLCVGFPSRSMKYRRMIMRNATWSDCLAFAAAS